MHMNPQLETLLKNGYKKDAADGVAALELMLDREPELAAEMDETVRLYSGEGTLSMDEALERIARIAEKYGKNEYSLDLLLIVNSLPNLYGKYAENNIPDSVFYESMDDIRCKINECVECKGVVGTFVADWYDRFFKLTCFGLGRFQYEALTFNDPDFTLRCGRTVKTGDTYINMHIPSRGIPLTDEVRLDSYRKAYAFFAPLFPDGTVIFGCSSWLLYPAHLEFLPEDMNIRKFIGDFEMVRGGDTEDFHDRWRVFGRYADLPDEQLPRDTKLRAAYAERLCSGGRTGRGFGLFAFDGEKIL